jgi:hypothetical protein
MGIEMIAPYRNNKKKGITQDGRKLRRYQEAWESREVVCLALNLPTFGSSL